MCLRASAQVPNRCGLVCETITLLGREKLHRINYVCWLSELVSLSRPASSEAGPSGDAVTCFDIGVGASCIYPLLGARMHGWRFIASDVDRESVDCAQMNVMRNELQTQIQIVHVEPSEEFQCALGMLCCTAVRT
jgi:23S rRNA (adenine1618-N6)-methyltransferase